MRNAFRHVLAGMLASQSNSPSIEGPGTGVLGLSFFDHRRLMRPSPNGLPQLSRATLAVTNRGSRRARLAIRVGTSRPDRGHSVLVHQRVS